MEAQRRAVNGPNDRLSAAPAAPLSQDATIAGVLADSRRDAAPIRAEFVQIGQGKHTRPGPLAEFVTAQDLRGLQAYLLLIAGASHEGDRGWDCTWGSDTWIRALDLRAHAAEAAARSAVSKTFGRLVDRQLVVRERVGRRASLLLLKEDGTGSPYTHPGAEKERYFKLPHTFWTDGDYRALTLPGVAALLIALSLADDFILPFAKAKPWYGIAPDTVQGGVHQLQDLGVLTHRTEWRINAKATGGYQSQRYYRLVGRYDSSLRASKNARPRRTSSRLRAATRAVTEVKQA